MLDSAIFDAAYSAVQPGQSGTRPSKLLAALSEELGGPAADEYVYHGRSQPVPGFRKAHLLWPGRGETESAGRNAVLSPVFDWRVARAAAWVDYYDDWSLAPDINPLHRMHAARSYTMARRSEADIFTCNSPYMAAKLRIGYDRVVPNGFDEHLALIEREDSDVRRLIVQGFFFDGRTDYSMLEAVAASGRFDEIVICAPGQSRNMRKALESMKSMSGRLIVRKWVGDAELAGLISNRTAVLIPHVVNDYTVSQDLMKAYKFLALGSKVICPRLLWPSTLPIEHAYLLDFGADPMAGIDRWIDAPGPSRRERAVMANDHSWRVRAKKVAELLGMSA